MEGLEDGAGYMEKISLSDLIAPYPNLRQALGDRWIAEQDLVDPIVSPYPLARWLRMDGFECDLTTLNMVLHKLETVSGIADRRRRIRGDAPALMETLTELYFGAWLLDRGYQFDWPRKGADFLVYLGDDQTLAIEVTTPRKASGSEDLFERLDLVALRTGHAVRIEHSLELLPDSAFSTSFVATVVRQVLNKLEVAGSESREIVENQYNYIDYRRYEKYREHGMKITWTPSASPGISKISSPGPTTPYSGFYELVSAAGNKAKQLPEERAGVLAFGSNQQSIPWYSFVDSLRRQHSEVTQFDWSFLPNQVKYVVLYSMELRRIEPFDAIWITNPASQFSDPPGAVQFFRDLFPFPLRGTQDSINS